MTAARGRNTRSRQPARRKARATRDFWGGAIDADDADEELIRPVSEPTALIRSLGSPPLPGNAANAAEHYFAVVYERAAGLAVALAAAADMLDLDDGNEAEAEAERN
ncbi:MAG: hypothetical protein ABWZ15_07970 [Acidimicrobiia bacterium]